MRYPTSFQTTDCVIVNREKKQILLGRKANNTKWCFIGGFVDPSDKSLEYANVRERIEEAGPNLECSFPKYLFSFRVDDERYRDSEDKILTAVFLCEYIFGFAEACDDIAEVKWFDIDFLKRNYKEIFVYKHCPIWEKVQETGQV